MTVQPLRIAILAHSTNPRGGVVHALALADALCRLGHKAVAHAPDARGQGFFRATLCETASVPATPARGDTTEMVETRVADYLRHFDEPAHRRFDLFHAQDGISGNALATMKERGQIVRFARTVHHIDAFADPKLEALQRRSIAAADELFVVSGTWRETLAALFGRTATVIGNGVDAKTYSPIRDDTDRALAGRLKLGVGPIYLAIGGVEARKNTIRILEAFREVHAVKPTAQLVIAGGASLLDHAAYQQRFAETLASAGMPAGAVMQIGPLDQADMPPLYRAADALVFPSLKEGFGLVVLEAMASGIPVIVSRVAPFTEYLAGNEAIWCDPETPATIANAMLAALDPALRRRLAANAARVVAAHDWTRTAEAHLSVYRTMTEAQHA